ncbi:MAG: glycosyltransferase family 2 protein [Aestuariivirga sp.]|uniref:glycosyltransferase family 2 protein n=1 Tax=Aestuariivirga sp. TaxID=2650926 RepID=UPI0025C11F59|nr:glycosyltransferase family 2 protein [Aestuariivirga sp.]MCA3562119.1 glycosyltransferase family 2 protein [Aestuariivirga sp.]
MADNIRYSIVIPIFNEAEVIPELILRLDKLIAQLDGSVEVLLVDDGSRDDSAFMLREKARHDPRYRLLRMSRNFGHQIAITAGLDHASGDAVIVMDADLQDPPEVVLAMIGKWKEGWEIVSGRRSRRENETLFKRLSAYIYYRILRRFSSVGIDPDVGDFRLLDRQVVESFRSMREQDRFVRGMISWLGFRQTYVEYVRQGRHAGKTKYPLIKMIRLALSGIIGFSDAPLRMAFWFGTAVSLAALAYGIIVIINWLLHDATVQGWASTVVILSLLGGINLMTMGIVGLYVGRIFSQVKERPLYVLRQDHDRDRQPRVGH